MTTSREVQFRDVVLMTAVNHQFTSYLQNWEIISSELGLQWVVLSFDNATNSHFKRPHVRCGVCGWYLRFDNLETHFKKFHQSYN